MNLANTNGGKATDTKAAAKDGDKNGETDGAPASSGQTPTSANVQPVAAAIALNSPAAAAPPPTDALAAIGAQAKLRPKATTPSASDQDATAQDAADQAADSSARTPATAADQTSSANPSGSTSASTGTPTDATSLVAGGQQTQVQADTDAAVLAQTEAAVQASGGRTGSRGDVGGATAAQGTGAVASAPGTSGSATALPNFGLVAANTLSTGAAASAATSSATVPVAGLAVAIASRAQAGSNQFDIRLDPPELGRIDVRLGVDSNGQVTTHVTVDRADTLQLLQSQQPQLERALEQAGLRTADNGLQFTLRDQSFSGQNGAGNGGGQQNTTQLVIPDAEMAPIDTTQIYSRWSLGSGLDIRV